MRVERRSGGEEGAGATEDVATSDGSFTCETEDSDTEELSGTGNDSTGSGSARLDDGSTTGVCEIAV